MTNPLCESEIAFSNTAKRRSMPKVGPITRIIAVACAVACAAASAAIAKATAIFYVIARVTVGIISMSIRSIIVSNAVSRRMRMCRLAHMAESHNCSL